MHLTGDNAALSGRNGGSSKVPLFWGRFPKSLSARVGWLEPMFVPPIIFSSPHRQWHLAVMRSPSRAPASSNKGAAPCASNISSEILYWINVSTTPPRAFAREPTAPRQALSARGLFPGHVQPNPLRRLNGLRHPDCSPTNS
jgi:hypothetical protein